MQNECNYSQACQRSTRVNQIFDVLQWQFAKCQIENPSSFSYSTRKEHRSYGQLVQQDHQPYHKNTKNMHESRYLALLKKPILQQAEQSLERFYKKNDKFWESCWIVLAKLKNICKQLVAFLIAGKRPSRTIKSISWNEWTSQMNFSPLKFIGNISQLPVQISAKHEFNMLVKTDLSLSLPGTL